jgi:hypothetical protein
MIARPSIAQLVALVTLLTACAPAYQPKAVLPPGQSEAQLQTAIDACREGAKAAVRAH